MNRFWFLFLFLMPVHAQESSPASAAPSFLIVTFGDSTTAPRKGVDVYTSQLETRLKSSPIPVRLVNKGVGGNTTAMAMKRFKTDVLDEKPDLVIIQFGINDSMVDVWKTPPAQASRVSLEDYEKNLRFFVAEIRRNGGDVILMTPNPLRWTPLLHHNYDKPPYDPSDEKGLTSILEKYAQAMRAIAHDLNVPLVDVYALYDTWEKTNGESCLKLLGDGMHPNTRGHTLTTDTLEPIVKSKVASKTGASSSPVK